LVRQFYIDSYRYSNFKAKDKALKLVEGKLEKLKNWTRMGEINKIFGRQNSMWSKAPSLKVSNLEGGCVCKSLF